MKKFQFLVAILFIGLASCNKHDEQPKGEFATGVFVVNEGNFGSSNGEISFYTPGTGSVIQDIYGFKNGNNKLGDVIQSMTVDNGKAYLLANGSNKIEVVDANTFASEYTVEGLKLPRYMTILNGKGYITEWVSYVDYGRVSVLNLQTHSVEKTIQCDVGAENIVVAHNEIYVSNNFSNTVFVIDPIANQVIDTVNVGWSPGSLLTDKDNNLWVICGGQYGENDGTLHRINTTTHIVDKTIELDMNPVPKLVINKAKDKFYYFDNTHVYAVGSASAVASSTPLITEATAIAFYGIGVDPESDIIYVGDALAFTASGVVFRYSADGAKLDTFTSGIAPNGFVFK